MVEIGLFPLETVLLPGERLPLHIFEERYKELIGECLDRGTEFGLVLSKDDGMRRVGTRAAVIEVLERFPDGRLNVVVEGRDRFRIVRITEGRSFVTAEIVDVPDEDDAPPGPDELARCLDAYRRLAEAAEVEPEPVESAVGNVAFEIAGLVDMGVDPKQELLELRSERTRVDRLAGLLEDVMAALRWREVVRERAAGDGQVRGPEDEGTGS